MNLAQLRDAVRTRIGVPASDSFYTDPVLTDLVNESVQAVAAEHDWPWLQASTTFNTVAGTQAYTPPVDWNRTKALTVDGFDSIQWRSLQEIREYPSTSRGNPAFFTVYGDQLRLTPVPDAVYVIQHDYLKDEPFLAGDTDTPLLPAQFHYAIVAFAVHLAHARNNEIGSFRGAVTGSAAAALQQYKMWLTRIETQYLRQTRPLRVRVRPGGGYQ